MRLVAPLYACPRSGLVNPTPEAVTMLAELDALCAADPSWLPPMAFLARRTGNIIDVDFEVMAGFSLLPSAPVTLGLTYSGAAITTAGVVDDPDRADDQAAHHADNSGGGHPALCVRSCSCRREHARQLVGDVAHRPALYRHALPSN